MRIPLARTLGAAVVVTLATACMKVDAAPPETAPPAAVVTVTAGDYFFQMPDTLPAGLTTFRLVNSGAELHHIQAVRLAPGRTMKELMGHMATGAHVFPSWATEVGGPNAPVPGETTEATLDLQPGDYAIICVIPSPDGTPHVMKGMMKQVTVVPAKGAAATAPTADVVMVLDDYSFDVTPALTAGRHVIRVENRASQPHEVVLVQLAPGKTPAEVAGWLEKQQGPPPGKAVGGVTGMAKGTINYFTAEVPAGEYALLCFLPDAGDGKSHVAHGMMRQISVK